MKVSREARLGLGIALVLGLVIGVPLYFLAGVIPSLSSITQSSNPTPDDVVQAFKDEGLEVGNPYPVDEDPTWTSNLVPKTYTEGTRFNIGRDQGGQVLIFKNRDDLEVMKKYWEGFNSQGGMLYSHVYVNDLMILHMNGQLPKPKAEEYNAVFQRL